MKQVSYSAFATKHRCTTFSSALQLLIFMLSLSVTACHKPAPEEDPAPGGDPGSTVQTGWLGSENSSSIPNDPLLFSGSTPSSVDLTPFLPPIGDQGQTGTCVAWACGYYQRTALQAIQQNLSSSQLRNSSRQFSPKDLFWSIPNGSNYKGQDCNGTQFQHALDQLQQRGVATLQTVPFQNLGDCSSQPSASWTNEAANYKIESYRDLPVSVEALKAKLAEKRPLVFGAKVTTGFKKWRGSSVMRSNDVLDGSSSGGHAMTIVGYDDNRNAFRIANSWGEDWGDNGFAWVDYSLMTNPQFTKYAFVAYDKPAADPVTPGPTANGMNIAMTYLTDKDNTDESDPRKRRLTYNLKNTGSKTVRASKDWHILYMYVNAYDIDDYGVILHRYISNDEGSIGDQGTYDAGLGSSSNRWIYVDISPNETMGEALFGSSTSKISANFTMPSIDGDYYLVMIADAFEDLDEEYLNDNLYFLYGSDGGPIYFQDGIGYGLQSDGADDRSALTDPHTPVNTQHPNAYRPAEIRGYLLQQYRAGKLLGHGSGDAGTAPDAAQ